MPSLTDANPSFLGVRLSDPGKRGDVEVALNALVPGEGGKPLYQIGSNLFVIARPVYERARVTMPNGEFRAWLAKRPGVKEVVALDAPTLISTFESGGPTMQSVTAGAMDKGMPAAGQRVPQDFWNLVAVKAPEAWDIARTARPGVEFPWSDVRVGHFDTGYTDHECFGDPSCIDKSLGRNVFDPAASGIVPKDPLLPNGTPGHGTRTGSVIAGCMPGSFWGVAPKVRLVPFRVCGFVVIDTSSGYNPLDKAMRRAIECGCDVVSISLGEPCNPGLEWRKAIDAAYEAGVIVVAAAGNVTSEVTYPGRFSRTICAGGVSPGGLPWTGGSRGRKVDVCAPADEVWRALTPDPKNPLPAGLKYSSNDGDGTSYATAHVAGAAAIWLAHAKATLDAYRGWRRVEAFRTAVRQSAHRPLGWDERLFGAGILDIAALLRTPLAAPADLSAAPSALPERY
jgi:subtilisin family serine protease